MSVLMEQSNQMHLNDEKSSSKPNRESISAQIELLPIDYHVRCPQTAFVGMISFQDSPAWINLLDNPISERTASTMRSLAGVVAFSTFCTSYNNDVVYAYLTGDSINLISRQSMVFECERER